MKDFKGIDMIELFCRNMIEFSYRKDKLIESIFPSIYTLQSTIKRYEDINIHVPSNIFELHIKTVFNEFMNHICRYCNRSLFYLSIPSSTDCDKHFILDYLQDNDGKVVTTENLDLVFNFHDYKKFMSDYLKMQDKKQEGVSSTDWRGFLLNRGYMLYSNMYSQILEKLKPNNFYSLETKDDIDEDYAMVLKYINDSLLSGVVDEYIHIADILMGYFVF